MFYTLDFRYNTQLQEQGEQHVEEVRRLQDQLSRERQRAAEDRAQLEREVEHVRTAGADRAREELQRVREEEEGKRRLLNKKHAAELTLLKEGEAAERAELFQRARDIMSSPHFQPTEN